MYNCTTDLLLYDVAKFLKNTRSAVQKQAFIDIRLRRGHTRN